eukprot:458237-Pelagomonas_calceolata.AAC.3
MARCGLHAARADMSIVLLGHRGCFETTNSLRTQFPCLPFFEVGSVSLPTLFLRPSEQDICAHSSPVLVTLTSTSRPIHGRWSLSPGGALSCFPVTHAYCLFMNRTLLLLTAFVGALQTAKGVHRKERLGGSLYDLVPTAARRLL